MGEYIPLIIALVIIVLICAIIYLAVSYAFETYENRRLQEEINSGFHYTIGLNRSLAKDVEFLGNELRPYRRLAERYGCRDAIKLEKLIIDLQDQLYRKDKDR